MRRRLLLLGVAAASALAAALPAAAGNPPPGFVYLRDVDPTIRQDIRYATAYNFTGRRVPGYRGAECILARPAALALRRVQAAAWRQGYVLKVYDCYRPRRAVAAFVRWAADPRRQSMKRAFFPRVDKRRVIELGYVAAQSTHSRGDAVDLTLVRADAPLMGRVAARSVTGSCIAPWGRRPPDNSVDMGTGYDCFDELSHTANPKIAGRARRHRDLLVRMMAAEGFVSYDREWWHFNYAPAPFQQRFDFPILPRTAR